MSTTTAHEIYQANHQPKELLQKRSLSYHLHTIWFFTVADFKTIVIPETAFGIVGALTPLLTTNSDPKVYEILSRVPQVALWNYLNLFLFNLANQRLPGSIIEDSNNKKWRPIPTGRITPTETRRLLLAVIPVVFVGNLFLGDIDETVALMVLTWMYNDLGGADELYIVRNLNNAVAYMCYSSGSLKVAAGPHAMTPRAYTWVAIIGAIIFSTLSVQDLADTVGDAAKGRRTSPLIMGDSFSRWESAIPILLWSIFCPVFWDVTWIGYVFALGIGTWLAFRVIHFRDVASDKVSWNTWCLWLGMMHALPLCAKN